MSRSTLADGIRCLRRKLALHGRQEESDEQLLHAFTSRRDDTAFAVLVQRHGPMVMNVCRHVLGHHQDAEDAFQATFFVLARNAAALRDKTALAGFLHGTAYRTAMKARKSAALRRKREGTSPLGASEGGVRAAVDPADELSWREVRALLDEEIARLPEIYRSAFVACHLQNASRAEAARRLGVKEGTLSSRLAEAHKRLARRLSRRGVELAAVLAAAAVATPSSAASDALMTTTINAASAIAAGEKLAGLISPSVAELAQSAATAILTSKAKMAAVVLLIVATSCSLVGWSWWASEPLAATAEPPAAKPSEKPPTASPQREAAKTVEVRGRVLDAEGKPKAGAKLLLLGEDEKIAEIGVTAADGRFAVAVPKQAKDRSLIASSEDAGIDFLHANHWRSGKSVELLLVKDRPIRGRIINTEGRPVSGVRVAARLIRVYANNSLDSFVVGWTKRQGNSEMPEGVKTLWPGEAPFFAATTDAEGRFILRGVGSERVISLRFSGAGIASTERWIVNRDGFDAKPYNQELRTNSPRRVFYGPCTMLSGPDVPLVAEREKILRGIVKDADTGKGLARATVWLTGNGDHPVLGGMLALPLKVQTDGKGRYEIRGARKMKFYLFQVMKDAARGYLDRVLLAEDTLGYSPLNVDIMVRKGVIVTGKIIEKATGKHLPGSIETVILNGNPFAKDYGMDAKYSRMLENAETGKDGTFRDVVVPGPTLLKASIDWTRVPGGVMEVLGYKRSIPDPEYRQYFQVKPDGETYYIGLNGIPGGVGGNACKVLDAKPGTAIVHQDLFVERESARIVKIQGAEGRPLSRVWATNLRPDASDPVRLNGDSCPVYALEAGKRRLMVFYEPNKKLAAALKLSADEKELIAVKLRPAGAIGGRLLDAEGRPLAGIAVDVRYRDSGAGEIHRIIHKAKQSVTDASGAFSRDELIPELKFELLFNHGRERYERITKPADPEIQVKPGETKDTGDLSVQSMK